MGFWELGGYHNDADPWQEQRHWFLIPALKRAGRVPTS